MRTLQPALPLSPPLPLPLPLMPFCLCNTQVTQLERHMNVLVLILFATVIVFSSLLAAGDQIWMNTHPGNRAASIQLLYLVLNPGDRTDIPGIRICVSRPVCSTYFPSSLSPPSPPLNQGPGISSSRASGRIWAWWVARVWVGCTDRPCQSTPQCDDLVCCPLHCCPLILL